MKKLLGKHPAKTKPIIDAERYGTLKSLLQKELFQPFDESKAFFPEETALIKRIRTATAALNRNNITRTQAYLAFYNQSRGPLGVFSTYGFEEWRIPYV
ncbi:hypothetical protein [Peribacillus simplex]|uniref:hypothetical protein n=1 Tax=Peribacillus simplex TaxID=1478 RepID=UPI003EB8C3E8